MPLDVDDDDFDHQIKLLMIGDSGVGKTCLLLRYDEDYFTQTFITTIGIDFKLKAMMYKGKKVRMQIWDTAGQERFRTITTSYFRGAQGIILCYDITEKNTFKNLQNWVRQIKLHAERDVQLILVGNKCDMEVDRKVSTEEGQMVADHYKIAFYETSAKEDINVTDSFTSLAHQVVDKAIRLEAKTDGVVTSDAKTTKGCAC